MDIEAAVRIVDALLHGVDPRTRELIDPDSLLQSGDVIRALWITMRVVEKTLPDRIRKKLQVQANARKAWSEEEDRTLLQYIERDCFPLQISYLLERNAREIYSRARKHGWYITMLGAWEFRDTSASAGSETEGAGVNQENASLSDETKLN